LSKTLKRGITRNDNFLNEQTVPNIQNLHHEDPDIIGSPKVSEDDSPAQKRKLGDKFMVTTVINAGLTSDLKNIHLEPVINKV